MKTYPRKPMVEISNDAEIVYKILCDHMDGDGYLGLLETMEVTLEGIEELDTVPKLSDCMTELQKASMVFPLVERSGWIVRFPIVRF